jgi:FkbM family methyltransferase
VTPSSVSRLAQRLAARGRRLRIQRRSRPRLYAYLGPDLAVAETTDGLFLYVDPQDEQIAPHIICRGYWEAWIDIAIGRILRPGDRVVEVGANFGYHSVKMARAIGSDGHLDTFEASPYLAALVGRSLQLNDFGARSAVHPVAASDRPGEVAFSVSRRFGGSGFVADPDWPERPGRETITAPSVRLDDVIEGAINFLRMDAEGSEPLILEGARDLIARSPLIRICMEWSTNMMARRCNVPDLVAKFRAQGFRFWLIATDGAFPELSDADLMALPLNDILICRGRPLP